MAYTPPISNSISFTLKAYTVPSADAISFSIGGSGISLTAFPLTLASPIVGNTELAQRHTIAGTGITTGEVAIGTPLVAQTHQLGPNGVVTGAVILALPTATQVHTMAATALTLPPVSLGQPSTTQTHTLSATALTTQSVDIGRPILAKDAVLEAAPLLLGTPLLGSPEFTQIHNVQAELTLNAPLIGAGTLGAIYNFNSNEIVTPPSEFSIPAFSQIHSIFGTAIATESVEIGQPNIIVGITLQATDLEIGTWALGIPSCRDIPAEEWVNEIFLAASQATHQQQGISWANSAIVVQSQSSTGLSAGSHGNLITDIRSDIVWEQNYTSTSRLTLELLSPLTANQ